MKVKELIEFLSKFDQEADILIPGYEGGYKDVTSIEKEYYVKNVNSEWFYGPHELCTDQSSDKDSKNKCVVLK